MVNASLRVDIVMKQSDDLHILSYRQLYVQATATLTMTASRAQIGRRQIAYRRKRSISDVGVVLLVLVYLGRRSLAQSHQAHQMLELDQARRRDEAVPKTRLCIPMTC